MYKLDYQMGECLRESFDVWGALDNIWLPVISYVQDDLNEEFSNDVQNVMTRVTNMYKESIYNRIDLGESISSLMAYVKIDYDYQVHDEVHSQVMFNEVDITGSLLLTLKELEYY